MIALILAATAWAHPGPETHDEHPTEEVPAEEVPAEQVPATEEPAAEEPVSETLGETPPASNGTPPVHSPRVKAKRTPYPKYPKAAKKLDLGDVDCMVEFVIEENGKPLDVTLSNCPDVFHEATLDAMWKWRFHPLQIDGEPTEARFTVKVHYQLES